MKPKVLMSCSSSNGSCDCSKSVEGSTLEECLLDVDKDGDGRRSRLCVGWMWLVRGVGWPAVDTGPRRES